MLERELTRLPNGLEAPILPPNAVKKSGTYTVVSNTDAGTVFYVTEDTVFTLPAIAVGNTFTFINMGKDGQAQITLSPNASDGINYKGSATDDKDLINTKATAKRGDSVTLASLSGTTAWEVSSATGIWAKEA